MRDIIDELRKSLPPVWLGSLTGELTGGACPSWETIQNKRSKREIPEDCFCRSGPRILVIREPFLKWWGTTLRDARKARATPPPRAGRKRSSRADSITASPTALAAQGVLARPDTAEPTALSAASSGGGTIASEN
jgi:hypothetical protein